MTIARASINPVPELTPISGRHPSALLRWCRYVGLRASFGRGKPARGGRASMRDWGADEKAEMTYTWAQIAGLRSSQAGKRKVLDRGHAPIRSNGNLAVVMME